MVPKWWIWVINWACGGVFVKFSVVCACSGRGTHLRKKATSTHVSTLLVHYLCMWELEAHHLRTENQRPDALGHECKWVMCLSKGSISHQPLFGCRFTLCVFCCNLTYVYTHLWWLSLQIPPSSQTHCFTLFGCRTELSNGVDLWYHLVVLSMLVQVQVSSCVLWFLKRSNVNSTYQVSYHNADELSHSTDCL